MWGSIFRLLLVAVAAAVGYAVGWVGAMLANYGPQPADYPFLVEYSPLPHHVPRYPGGVSFRFAMAHDVIHERFPKHGPAHYRERDRLTREKLAALAPDDPAAFPLLDDLAVGLDRLGRPAEAVPVLRDKLARQQARGLTGRDLYTTYANLGTVLIHANFRQALAGDPAAKGAFREGVGFVRKSVEVNPEAHFGREQWQAAVAEFILAAMDNPDLLKTFDCVGNRLAPADPTTTGPTPGTNRAHDSGTFRFWAARLAIGRPEDPARWNDLKDVRGYVTKVGAEEGWNDVPVPSHREPVPFDEPVLGIIGMWRQGGGANPHFALAVGEVMLRVGQKRLTWAAFERAQRLADRYWPDPALQEFLRDHCRKRQAAIEYVLPPAVVAELRPRFEAELAHGEGYQRAYQEYEERKVAAGVPITDPHFFDEFHAGRESIASPSGPEEWYGRVPASEARAHDYRRASAWGVLLAGVAALLVATALRLRSRALPNSLALRGPPGPPAA